MYRVKVLTTFIENSDWANSNDYRLRYSRDSSTAIDVMPQPPAAVSAEAMDAKMDAANPVRHGHRITSQVADRSMSGTAEIAVTESNTKIEDGARTG